MDGDVRGWLIEDGINLFLDCRPNDDRRRQRSGRFEPSSRAGRPLFASLIEPRPGQVAHIPLAVAEEWARILIALGGATALRYPLTVPVEEIALSALDADATLYLPMDDLLIPRSRDPKGQCLSHVRVPRAWWQVIWGRNSDHKSDHNAPAEPSPAAETKGRRSVDETGDSAVCLEADRRFRSGDFGNFADALSALAHTASGGAPRKAKLQRLRRRAVTMGLQNGPQQDHN